MIQKPFTQSAKYILEHLQSDRDHGLNEEDILRRAERYGNNTLSVKEPKKRWRILADQFLDLIIYVLVAASLLAFLFGDWLEGTAILIVIIFTAAIGFFMELKAIRSLEALSKLGHQETTVLREGKIFRINASNLVPGDIILLETGDVVSADARLLESENLAVKEAMLTGESGAVEKTTSSLSAKTPISEQSNMVFRGTLITKGNAKAIVVAIGTNTELGKIQQMGHEIEPERSPLEKKLNRLSRRLIWLTLFFAILIVFTGYIRGKDILLMIETGVALAVAAIPEGLPIVATIALARGMLKLSKQQVIIKKMDAVETLGATNIICTDKTGTLTEDKLKVHTLALPSGQFEQIQHQKVEFIKSVIDPLAFDKIITTGILCNNVVLEAEKRRGDTIDLTLLEFAEEMGYDPLNIRKNNPENLEIPFDPNRKLMATAHKSKEGFHIYVKGAYENVVNCCNSIFKDGIIQNFNNKDYWNNLVEDLASQGLRTLAFAYKDSMNIPKVEDMLSTLTFIGVIGFIDPARDDVRATIEIFKSAGIKVVMMTGDHPGTAKKIAEEVGLLPTSSTSDLIILGKELGAFKQIGANLKKRLLNAIIYTRVTPKQKLELIKFYQENNNTIGMLGDGINDVPALIKADIGIAMGIRGTEAAREAADIILKNDKFTAMELAIRQGRMIYEHIRQFVVYLLSCNLAEIISVGMAAVLNFPSPLLPLQILFLNLVTDVFPALALGMGKGEKDIMQIHPRKPDEPLMTPKLWTTTVVLGLSITIAVLGLIAYTYLILKLSSAEINNMAFYTLIIAQLLNVFSIPRSSVSFLKNEVTSNPWIWGAIALSVIITFLAYSIPAMANTLSLVPISGIHLGIAVIFGFSSLVISQLFKRIGRMA